MKFNESERKFLKSLVMDCVLYNLPASQAMEYIRSRFDKPIGLTYYYMLKAQVEGDAEAQRWLTSYAKAGYIVSHKRRMSEMELAARTLLEMLHREKQKEEGPDTAAVTSIIDSLVKVSKMLVSLQNGAPVLAQVSAMLKGKNQQQSTIIANGVGEEDQQLQ